MGYKYHGGICNHIISKYIPQFLVFYTPQVSDRLRGGTEQSDRVSRSKALNKLRFRSQKSHSCYSLVIRVTLPVVTHFRQQTSSTQLPVITAILKRPLLALILHSSYYVTLPN